MKIYEFGENNKPVILLLPGTCCHWKATFSEVIPLPERSFYWLRKLSHIFLKKLKIISAIVWPPLMGVIYAFCLHIN